MTAPAAISAHQTRLASVDFLRGATVLAMLFVNDLAGVRETPWWAKHMPSTTDGMTFVDLVFPCFLFVVGLSIPLALGRRLAGGERAAATALQILVRTASLVFVGVVMVNMGGHNGHLISQPLWTALAYVCVLVLWHRGSGRSGAGGGGAKWELGLKLAAGALMLFLLAIYRANGPDGQALWLRSQWWGILGLIGWAYLVVALWWRMLPGDRAAMAGLVGLLTCLGLAKRGADGFFTGTPVISFVNSWVELGGQIGGHGSIVAAGAILGMGLRAGEGRARIVGSALAWGLGLVIAGFCLRPYTNGFSKDFATPAWCLLCAGLSAWLFAAAHWLLTPSDRGAAPLNGERGPLGAIVRIGQWALVPYILAPLIYALFTLTGFEPLYAAAPHGQWPTGILRSVVFTLGVGGLSLLAIRAGLRLRL